MSIKGDYVSAGPTNDYGNLREMVGKEYKGVTGTFWDYSNIFLPRRRDDILMLAEFFYLTNSIIRGGIKKLAEYALTELMFDSIKDEGMRAKWKEAMTEKIDIRGILLSAGVNFFTYGENFTIPHIPFSRYYKCKRCGAMHPSIRDIIKPRWEVRTIRRRINAQGKMLDSGQETPRHTLTGTCSARNCRRSSVFEIVDKRKDPRSVNTNLRFLNIHPKFFEIKENMYTGDKIFYMKIDESLAKDVKDYNPDMFDGTRLEIVKAVFENKPLRMIDSNVYHFKNIGLTSITNMSHGESAAMSTFKDLFFSQQLKHLQEVIARDRAVTYRAIIPDSSVPQLVDMTKYKDHIENEFKEWRKDPNHIAWFPTPITMAQFTGEAKNLFLSAEIQASNDNAIVGLEVPREFIYGNIGAYSGASVSMRMLENRFIAYVSQLNTFVRTFMVPKIAKYYSIDCKGEESGIKFQSFKMADDTQQKQFDLNLTNMGALSKRTLLQGTKGVDYSTEKTYIAEEAEDTAKVNAKTKSIEIKSGVKDQISAQIESQEANRQFTTTGKVQELKMFGQETVIRHPVIEEAASAIASAIKAAGPNAANVMVSVSNSYPAVFKRVLEKFPELTEMYQQILGAQEDIKVETETAMEQASGGGEIGKGPRAMPEGENGDSGQGEGSSPPTEQRPGKSLIQ